MERDDEAMTANPTPLPPEGVTMEPSFQQKVQPWLMACFGEMIAGDREERNHRFLEEALELVQACGCTASEAHQLVDYTYGRPIGELHQEVGGVMVTLAALCLANDADMHAAGWVELDRIWGKVEQIRAKQAAKPKHSQLPESSIAATSAAEGEVSEAFMKLCEALSIPATAGAWLEANRILARATKAEAANARFQWQPIETAPRDGSYILVCQLGRSEPSVTICCFDDEWGNDGWWLCCDGKNPEIPLRGPEPSHWMPYPEPPSRQALDQGSEG